MYDPPRLLSAGGEFSPKATGFEIDREELIAVVAFESLQPGFQRTPFRAFPEIRKSKIESPNSLFTNHQSSIENRQFPSALMTRSPQLQFP
jgi:hypothetical protein